MPAAIRKSRMGEGSPNPAARPGMGSASISRCSPPTPRRWNCACSTTPGAPSSSASNCLNTPTRSGTAICRMRALAPSTAIACMVRTSRRNGHRFNPNKLLLDPYAKAHVGALRLGRRAVRLHDRLDGRRPELRRARQRAVHAEVPGDRSGVHLGPRAPARGAMGPHHHLRDPRARLHQAASGGAGASARHVLRSGAQGGGGLHPHPRRHLGGTAADPRLRQRPATCWKRA